MKPNFPEVVKLKFKDQDKKTPSSTLDLAFELSSINFDINQATINTSTPFTAELSFELRLDPTVKLPASATDLNKLDALIQRFYNTAAAGQPIVPLYATFTDLLAQKVFGATDNIRVSFRDLGRAERPSLGDPIIYSPADDNFVIADSSKFVSVTDQSVDNADLATAKWLVQIKFLSKSGSNSLVLYPKLETTWVKTDSTPTLSAGNLSLGVVEQFAPLNDELKLSYELLVLIPTAANPANGQSSSQDLVSTIGKVSDEITDSFANLGATLADKLSNTVNARLQPVAGQISYDLALWMIIQKGTQDLSFQNYSDYMDEIFCGVPQTSLTANTAVKDKASKLSKSRALPFMGVDAYQSVKVATEAFVMVNCMADDVFNEEALLSLNKNVPLVNGAADQKKLDEWWGDYKEEVNGAGETIPYLAVIQRKMQDTGFKVNSFEDAFRQYAENGTTLSGSTCFGVIQEKLTHPCFLELIWSYWHEESMMVQGLNAMGRRFQNIKGPGAVDPLANLEIDPLRPLSNLMWGYIQDEQHRLTVRRRAYEYDHHYGISLQGSAVQNMRFADSRSKFIEAFHMLLHLTNKFYKQADDMTVQPDGFPILNALKETHLVLSEGAHNQYGDLPSVARAEMLMQQWLLARPEFRSFLPTRIMVAYPEPWMDRVSALNNLMGWTKTSVLHFRDLGVFGEQLLLSIRFGNWAGVNDRFSASNWANFWRPQIQAYIHAYRAATGVDLTADVPGARIDSMQPSVHLQRRLMEQRGKAA